MNALDSPLEALAFNYLNFAFSTAVNNIWPCLAVITAAAISFWKIRAAGLTSPAAKSIHRVDCRINDPRSTASMTTATPVNLVLESDGCSGNEGSRRRGKFTVYYEREGEGRDLKKGEEEGVEEECCWGGDWERGLRMRVGKDVSLGWYRYQDLTVLDGNVVKLWDVGCGGREFNQLVTAVW